MLQGWTRLLWFPGTGWYFFQNWGFDIPGYYKLKDHQQPKFRNLSEFYVITFLNKLIIVKKRGKRKQIKIIRLWLRIWGLSYIHIRTDVPAKHPLIGPASTSGNSRPEMFFINHATHIIIIHDRGTRVTWRVSLVEQELLTLQYPLSQLTCFYSGLCL